VIRAPAQRAHANYSLLLMVASPHLADNNLPKNEKGQLM
jgi:hypothetical protein